MSDSTGSSENAEPSVPTVTTVTTVAQGSPSGVPSFVCVLPCTAPPVKYLDRLDGCASGLHVTLEDAKDLQMSLYQRMYDVLKGEDDEPLVVGAVSSAPCPICKCPLVPRPTMPLIHLENCVHCFHRGCLDDWSREMWSRCGHYEVACPQCRVLSSRALLWPEPFLSAEAKQEKFQEQKRIFGLDVSPQALFLVERSYREDDFPVFRLNVNSKQITVCKRSPPPPPPPPPPPSPPPPSTEDQEQSDEAGLQLISIETFASRLETREEHERALSHFRCPIDRCSGTFYGCLFWHEPVTGEARRSTLERDDIVHRPFPRFFCVRKSKDVYHQGSCVERIRVHSQELVRCAAGFHPTVDDLKDVDEFARKMAHQIMTPLVVPQPEQHQACASCGKSAQPNSIWIHLQNCVHWLHDHCIPKARLVHSPNPNSKLDCPICNVSSVRAMIWPGPFPSQVAKKDIFALQLAHFNLSVQDDTQLAIAQVTEQLFTLDIGGPSVVTIDSANVDPDGGTIYYD